MSKAKPMRKSADVALRIFLMEKDFEKTLPATEGYIPKDEYADE